MRMLLSVIQTTPFNGSQIVMQTLERNISDEVHCEMDNVVAAAQATIHQSTRATILVAMDSLMNPKVELKFK